MKTTHHIVSDGWSQAVFHREFAALYAAEHDGCRSPLAPLPVQYADFTLWQRECLSDAALQSGLDFWREQLAELPDELRLPRDRPRPPELTFAAGSYRIVLSKPRTAALRTVMHAEGTTLYMTLLAALAILFERYTGQQDIVIGSPIANRDDPRAEALIGFFVETVALRMRVGGEDTFQDFLAAVRRRTLDAYQHQHVPFERVVELVAPPRSPNTTPVFQVTFALQNAPWVPLQLPGMTVEPVGATELRTRHDLEVYAWEEPDGTIGLEWLYNRDLFDQGRVEQMARHYQQVVDAIIADLASPIRALDIAPAAPPELAMASGAASSTELIADRRIVAYVVLAADATIDPAAVRDWLQTQLPGYMVPAAIVMLDEWPRTHNGKIDRRQLPAPHFTTTATYQPPRTPEEWKLAALFAEVLGVQRVGLDDDFFALGGHSLLVTRLASRIRAGLGRNLPLRALFDARTVRNVSTLLKLLIDAETLTMASGDTSRDDIYL